jgi:hypothetical protein
MMTKTKDKWEHVHRSSARGNEDAGSYHISLLRLPIEGGWLYKLTEWTDDHRDVSICFVPWERKP